MSYTLHLGDCLAYMKTMADKSVDCVVTDPPYGIGVDKAMHKNGGTQYGVALAAKRHYAATDWDAERISGEAISNVLRVSKQQVIFGGNYYADLLPASSSWIVWNKLTNGEFADCELAWTSHKKAVRQYTYMWNGMIKQMPEERYHPTQKPLSLMIWVLENYTKPNDLVFDPFMGSGTTGVACIKTGRRFVGCELDPAYFAIAQRRIENAAAQPMLFDAAQGAADADALGKFWPSLAQEPDGVDIFAGVYPVSGEPHEP